jgi:hypothetical protein
MSQFYHTLIIQLKTDSPSRSLQVGSDFVDARLVYCHGNCRLFVQVRDEQEADNAHIENRYH